MGEIKKGGTLPEGEAFSPEGSSMDCHACGKAGCFFRFEPSEFESEIFRGWILGVVSALFFVGPILLAVATGILCSLVEFNTTLGTLAGLALGMGMAMLITRFNCVRGNKTI